MGTCHRVYRFVLEHPGASVSEIARGLGIHHATADHHLRRLRRSGSIVIRRVGRVRIHHPRSAGTCRFQETVPVLLRSPWARQAALELLARSRVLRRNLIQRGATTSQARWCMARLSALGVGRADRSGALVADPERLPCLFRALHGQPCGAPPVCPLRHCDAPERPAGNETS